MAAPNSRTPQGVRGLKSPHAAGRPLHPSRTPQGVRGLKSCRKYLRRMRRVAPRKGCVD